MAKSFKFTKMSKKVPFLPSLHQKGEIAGGITSIDKDTGYQDTRTKQALIAPDRAGEKTHKFNLVTMEKTGYIGSIVGQEFDTYDEVMKKYMTKRDRGLLKPLPDG